MDGHLAMSHQSEFCEWMYMLFDRSNCMPKFQLLAIYMASCRFITRTGEKKAHMAGMRVRGNRVSLAALETIPDVPYGIRIGGQSLRIHFPGVERLPAEPAIGLSAGFRPLSSPRAPQHGVGNGGKTITISFLFVPE
jgi:hypothetical protein